MKATTMINNLLGEDRDVVSMRNRIKEKAASHLLPSAEDLDKIAEEQLIAEQTKARRIDGI